MQTNRWMRAVVLEKFGGPDVLTISEVAAPEPGPGQVRIRVQAAAVNPVDAATRAGLLQAAGLHDGPNLRLRLGRAWHGRRAWWWHPTAARGPAGHRPLRPAQRTEQDLCGPGGTRRIGGRRGAGHARPGRRLDRATGGTDRAAVTRPARAPTGPEPARDRHRRGSRWVRRPARPTAWPNGRRCRPAQGQSAAPGPTASITSSKPATASPTGSASWCPAGWTARSTAPFCTGPRWTACAMPAATSAWSSTISRRHCGESGRFRRPSEPTREQLSLLGALASAGALRTAVAAEFGLDKVREAHERFAAGGLGGRVVLRP